MDDSDRLIARIAGINSLSWLVDVSGCVNAMWQCDLSLTSLTFIS